MAKTFFPYVEDEILITEVKLILTNMSSSMTEIQKDLYDNVIDPFSAVFDSVGNNFSYDEWIQMEQGRQLQKTLQNSIGYFHQKILGSVDGWIDPGNGGGFDSENTERKIIAELKNKWNTLNSSSSEATYDKMVRFLDARKGYNGYVVIIIPKKPARFNKPFRVPGKEIREDLRTVDGATYYEMVTGDKDALMKLFTGLTEIIKTTHNGSFDQEKYLGLFNRAYFE